MVDYLSEKTYTIETAGESVFDREGSLKFANKTYKGFRRVLRGVYVGGFDGRVDGEDVLFIPNEIIKVLPE